MKSLIRLAFLLVFVLSSSIHVLAVQADSVSDFSCADVTEIPQSECEALVALYNSTNGPGWTNSTNWLVSNTPGNWYGVTITSGHVTDVVLSINNLLGNIPPEVGNLTSLQNLSLWSNQLSGSLPPELGDLTGLIYLLLDSNQLSGSIPPELGNLNLLSFLMLSGNQLSGSIPSELGNILMLQDLDLSNNQLTGSIPPELGNYNNMNYLFLNDNQLSGSIPAELGNLTFLRLLWLQGNRLEGDIPSTFVDLVHLYDPYQYNTQDGLDLDYNLLNIPPGYPDPGDPLQVFLSQKDPDWHLRQTILQSIFLPVIHR